MRALFMGQTGIGKRSHLQGLKTLCEAKGRPINGVFSVGDIMYEESRTAGKSLQEGKILDIPLGELGLLRRLAFTRISHESTTMDNMFVDSHAVFRWNNQLFKAFDLPELKELRPDIIITLIDDVEAVKLRLDDIQRSGALPTGTAYSLKDLMVWREEEILASEILASILGVDHYVLGVALEPEVTSNPLEPAFGLMFQPWKKRAYISYPISDAREKPEVWDKVLRFRKLARSYLTAFDPLMISEKRLHPLMVRRKQECPDAKELVCDVRGRNVQLNMQEIEAVIPDIDGQTVARDYKLIDQSDIVVAYFPLDVDGGPLVAGGVQSEIEHASASTKEVIIVWEAPRDPTPFIHQKADKRFDSLEELEVFLRDTSPGVGQLELPLGPD